MRSVIATLGLLSGLSCMAAQQQPFPAAQQSAASVMDATPAQQRIAAAEKQIHADPKKVQPYNELAIGIMKRARETGNSKLLDDAEKAIADGLRLDAEDFQLQRTQVELMLSRHQYAQAEERARVLNDRTPDDVMTYGLMAEAEIDLGDYEKAEKNAQWMLNMRPNNIPGLLIGARLRVLYGDPGGALEFLKIAYSETAPTEVEELAWMANQIAAIEIDSAQLDAAEQILGRAGDLFPHYAPTLKNLAHLRMEQHRAAEAITLLTEAGKLDDDPRTLYALAQAQLAAGKDAEARATLADFEGQAAKYAGQTEDSVADLILAYGAQPGTAPRALAVAKEQIALRHDIWTLDAYAWALYATGSYAEAQAEIQKAIAVGVQSSQIFNHAAHIEQKLNHPAEAAKFIDRAVLADPNSEWAAEWKSAARRSIGATQTASQQPSASAQVAGESAPAATIAPSPTPSILPDPTLDEAAYKYSSVPAGLLVPRPTETDRLIHKAQAEVSVNPKDAAGLAALGAAHFQRARETGDVADYQFAEDALTKSLDQVSADFSADAALGTMAEVCMGEHRFTDALAYAQKALSLGTGDVSPFAIVGDAYADMGEYEKARSAYARLTPPEMTLSPRAAYARDSRLAYLKFVSGDTAGAIVLMKTSVAEGAQAQLPSENQAWLYYELGEFYALAGQPAHADQAYLAALNTHPGDYRALAGLARLRANLGRSADAIELYQKAIAVVPMPIFVGELGDLYAKTGNPAEAKKQYQLVEYMGLLGKINQVLHNRDLAIFYADHDIKLAESLELARNELKVRHDVYSWDALAWSLYKNGQYTEAEEASGKALRFGTRDALLLYHAGMIAERGGHLEEARKRLQSALDLNPHFHLIYAASAQETLSSLALKAASHGKDQANAR